VFGECWMSPGGPSEAWSRGPVRVWWFGT
jgi:hypothetical protein